MSTVALVTGAGRGLGAAVAARLAGDGAQVVRADVTDPDGWVAGAGDRVSLDVRDAASCHAAVATTVARHGRLDVLVNGAGIVRRSPAATMTDEDWDEVLDVNLSGTFRVARAAHDALAATSGCVVNLASTNGQVAVPGTASYCASKAGVIQLTRVLALEWAHVPVRVNAVAPTIVATDMTADLRADDVFLADKLASIPLGRMATTADVAGTVAFLASADAAMITGQTVFVDGGATIH